MEKKYKEIVDICSTISVCYSYVAWIADIKPDLEKIFLNKPYEFEAVKIACLSSSLVSIRKFDDFFKNNKNQKDDVIASDFGYTEQTLLNKSERKEINKRVAHFTSCITDTIEKEWNIVDMLIRLGGILEGFLNHLLEKHGKGNPYTSLEISETLKFLKKHVAVLTALTIGCR